MLGSFYVYQHFISLRLALSPYHLCIGPSKLAAFKLPRQSSGGFQQSDVFFLLGPCACLKAFHVAPVLFRTMLMMLMDEIKHILVANHLISFECIWFIWVRCISNLLKAMIIDLLTIRADRDNYYYGCLFEFPGSGALEGCGSVELVRMCNANHVSWSRIVVNFA